MTVNGNKNWQMRSAKSLSDLYPGAVIVSSNRGCLTINRSLEAIAKRIKKEEYASAEESKGEKE